MATTTKAKKPAAPEKKLRRNATKLIAFTKWRQEWREANPNGTKEERKEAWVAARKAETLKARKALKALEKSGMKVTAA